MRGRPDQWEDRSQSIGSAPCSTSKSLVRLKGRDPKKPYRADMGEGCEDLTIGTPPSMGSRDCASRPHRMATSGPPRATRASMAVWVTSSHPLPRCEAGRPGWTVRHLLRSNTPCSNQPVRSPCSQGKFPGRTAIRRRCSARTGATDARRAPPRNSGPRGGLGWGRGPDRR